MEFPTQQPGQKESLAVVLRRYVFHQSKWCLWLYHARLHPERDKSATKCHFHESHLFSLWNCFRFFSGILVPLKGWQWLIVLPATFKDVVVQPKKSWESFSWNGFLLSQRLHSFGKMHVSSLRMQIHKYFVHSSRVLADANSSKQPQKGSERT